MKGKRLALVLGGLAFIAAASAAGYQSGYGAGFRLGKLEGRQAGEDRFDREWSDIGGHPAFANQIRDAQLRWNAKNNLPSDHFDPDRTPIVMSFSDQVCVKLKLSSGSIGGSPAYCYSGASTQLIKDDSNVE